MRVGRDMMMLLLAAGCAFVLPAFGEEQTTDGAATGRAPVATTASEASLAVRDVRIEPNGSGRQVVIRLSRAPEGVRNFTLPRPPRLVIDVAGPVRGGDSRELRFPLDDGVVSGVRAARYKGHLRVVVDLAERAPVGSVRADGDLVIADLGGGAAAPEKVSEAAPGDPIVPTGDVAVADGDTGLEAAPGAQNRSTEVPNTDLVAAAAPEKTLFLAPAKAPAPTPVSATPPPRPGQAVDEQFAHNRAKALRPEPAPQVFGGQRISLDFKDADIQNVLRVLADVSNLNIIATDDVKGRITLHLSDVPWDQALDLILRTNRLEMTQEGNVVRISTVNRLKEEREALRAAADAEVELEPLRISYQRVNYARADESLIDKVRGVLTDRGSVTFDERTNTIIVRDIQRGIHDAEQLIHELDVQSPQVLIEANIVEATEDFARGLGVQWGYRYLAGPATGNPTGSNFPGTVGVGGSGLGAGVPAPPNAAGQSTVVPFVADFPVPGNFASGFGPGVGSALDLALGSLDGTSSLSARLTALEEQGKGKVISRPRVITMNNVAATIQSLTILRVKLPSTGTVINTGTGGVAGGSSTATEKINTGITLVVTPQVSADGYVLMNIYAKSSQPDFTRAVDNIPNEISREANSNVLIQDGETVVLGGIFRHTGDDRETGLPYLRNVPAIGWLFKRTLRTKRHEELLVFLTPKIVQTGNVALPSAQRLWEERRQGG